MTTIQDIIKQETQDGRTIIRFLVSTMNGQTPHAKPCHRLDAAKYLIKLGFQDDLQPEAPNTTDTTTPDTTTPKSTSPSSSPSMSAPVFTPDPQLPQKITAAIIQDQTHNGASVITFLNNVMNGTHPHAKPHHRLNAATQLLSILFQDRFKGSPKQYTPSSSQHSALTQHVRETTNPHKLINFLIEIMDGGKPDLTTDPTGKTPTYNLHHSLTAAGELLQRGFNTFTDQQIRQALQAPVIHIQHCHCPPTAPYCPDLYNAYKNGTPATQPHLHTYTWHSNTPAPTPTPYHLPSTPTPKSTPSSPTSQPASSPTSPASPPASTPSHPPLFAPPSPNPSLFTPSPSPSSHPSKLLPSKPIQPHTPTSPSSSPSIFPSDLDAELDRIIRANRAWASIFVHHHPDGSTTQNGIHTPARRTHRPIPQTRSP